MAIRKLENKSKINVADVGKVLQIIKSNSKSNKGDGIREKEETTAKKPIKEMDVSYFTTYRSFVEEDAEQVPCCDNIKISSKEKVMEMYPFLLGDYKQIESKSNRNLYSKSGKQQLYLSLPKSAGQVRGYTWGVSQSPEAKWGYIRSSKGSSCPTMAGQWKVFDRNTKKWVVDNTLQVVCTGK